MAMTSPFSRTNVLDALRAKRGAARTFMRFVTSALLCAATLSCVTNEISGRSQLLLLPESEELSMGVQAYQEMTVDSGVPVKTDPAWVDPLMRVGAAISQAADRPDYDWEFKLIDEPTVNAWALPGGKIAFYTGIYPVLQDEAGMAIVMGHEVSHALLRHGGERISQNLISSGLMAGIAVALGENEYKNEIMGALGVGANVGVMLPFSRSHESEADYHGLLLAARAGYDPEAAIGVWERMAAMSEGQRPPELLSTHPDPLNRIENMQKWMPEAKALYEASNKQPNRRLPTG